MTRDDIAALLLLRDRAYDLVLHLCDVGKQEPDRLDQDTVARLATRTGWRQWLDANWDRVPDDMRPSPEDREAFINLLWSFFQVSFRIDTFEWDGAMLDADLHTGARARPGQPGLRQVKVEAVRRLCRRSGVDVTDRKLRNLVKCDRLRTEISIWTYAWELRQRARGKAKGRALHRLWRSMDFDVRKHIDADAVVAASESIVAAVAGAPIEKGTD